MMARSVVLSNGELAVALDERAQVRDIYYPHVGYEDHVRGHYVHRIGVWTDGRLVWLSDESWKLVIELEEDALVSRIVATHAELGVELRMSDVVYNERAIFVREVSVTNLASRGRDIRVYFAQQFEISKMHGGDTAYYDPESHAIVHYKGRRVFLISATIDGTPFQDFATGLAGFQGHEGTHKDAEDGVLSKNPIEHGPADSVVGVYGTYEPLGVKTIEYSIVAAQSIPDAHELSAVLHEKTPSHIVKSTRDYWRAWVGAYQWHFEGLDPALSALFRRSLLYIRAHADQDGGILASLDSDMLNYGIDTYTYIWPRDAAYSAIALDSAGDRATARRFFHFCKEIIRKEGYLMHKYLPDRSLGSSWHPWVRNGVVELPIQEDETALVIYAIGEHYKHTRDVELLEELYNPLIQKAANFMVGYRDHATGLPLTSYDLWEEKRGTHTFTCAAVYGALVAAADMALVLGKKDDELTFRTVAEEIREGILKFLWDEKKGIFYKLIAHEGDTMRIDETLDMSSAYGVFAFGVLPVGDVRLKRAFDMSVLRLSHGIAVGGIARYEGDNYYREHAEAAGNPWITTTLWYAEYLIASSRNDHELQRVKDIFKWTLKYALSSGVLTEQLDPRTGAHVSAAPLCWSHAAYVNAIVLYLNRLEELGLCDLCNPVD